MSTRLIPIGKWGKIISGRENGLFICVQDDSVGTGGVFVFTGRAMSVKECWDNWFENMSQVQNHFDHSDWEIEWSEILCDFQK
jgi:hypothetical protein